MSNPERPPILDRVHDVLVLLLVAMRPWCWDGTPGQSADLVWQALAVGALLIAAIERAAGLRQAWAWSWRGALGLVLILALLPCALHAPEPAPSWCRWTGWVACIAASAYLVQVISGRQRLAIAGLAAGLAVTALLGVAQPVWVLPAMAAAQQAGSSLFAGMAGDGGAVAERIANGGSFSTFTLANQFGAYLALLVPVFAGIAWASRGVARWTAAGLTVLALIALAQTGAKGAWLALAAGCGLAWWLAWPGRWWRWLPLPLGVLGIAAVLHLGLAKASIDVRVGYWRSAVAIANEAPLTGHGLGGFAAQQPRVMSPGDEPTRFVHNEVLEAAVAGGWGLAALLAASLLVLAWPRRGAVEDQPADVPPRALVIVLGAAVPYLALLGAFDGNIGWWPGAGNLIATVGWAVLLGGAAATIAAGLWLATPPPAWVWAAGLCAVALKALIDFDFHAGGLIGTILLVAVCTGAPARQAAGLCGRWLPMAGAAGAAVVVIAGMITALRLNEAEEWLAAARQAGDPDVASGLARRLQLEPATPPPVLAAEAGRRAWAAAEGAPGIRLGALKAMPAEPHTLDLAEELADSAPHSAAAALHHAALLIAAKRWSDAEAETDRAVRLAPTAPRVLEQGAGLFEHLPGETAVARAAALRREAARLRPLVHPGMR